MKSNVFKRVMSLVLCLALVMSYLPMTAKAEIEDASGQMADASTMDRWQDLFLGDPLSTEHAGTVWTDKSVFTDNSAFLGTGITMDKKDSFLVALSAMGSNMAVSGMSSMPTDTMLVLDVSGSMNDNQGNNDVAEELVAAANEAIATLLAANSQNRVGVVLYSGPTTQGGATSASDAVLILPLGRYTTGADQAYLSYIMQTSTSSSGGRPGRPGQTVTTTTEYVGLDADVVYEGTATKPTATTKEVVGGTYIQKGLALAMNQFIASGNTTTVEDPKMGIVTRKPIMVLMSDGAPTVASTAFADPTAINLGDGTSTSAAIGFVTQLTAAYAKAQIEAKYGVDSLFYTLGLGTTDDEVATSVMDPTRSSTAINDFWTSYNNASVGGTVTVQGSDKDARNVTKLAQALEKNYVDQAFSVAAGSNLAQGLAEAFRQIVGAIQLQSRYFPTLVGTSEDLSGYVSFVDKIGQYMDVVDIKGILINNVLFSGLDLAKNFAEGGNGGDLGTSENPKPLGDEMVHSVQQRLGLSSADEARTLIGLAYQYGQLSYTSDSEFSNYIGWYANAAGQFLGFWQEGSTTIPEPTGNAATDPAFLIKSYGYLGAVDEEHGVAESDMMYATVQVRENIATGEESVVFAVPAALVPIMTYEVSLDKDNKLTGLTTSGAEHPIRLVYEVALDARINPFTVKDIVSSEYLAANTDANGNISFYTNQYEADGSVGYGKVNTYSYFNPSRQNDHYYYLKDALVCTDTDGTLYTGDAQPSGTNYRAYTVYVKDGARYRMETHYRKLSDAAMATAKRNADGSWSVPAGNVHVDLADNAVLKGEANATGTLDYSYLPFVDAHNHSVGETGYNFIVGATLGNNGKLLVTPATGIALTKTMAPDATAPSSAFTFEIVNVTNPADNGTYPIVVCHADGTTSITAVTFKDGKASVSLNAGETLKIGGMTAGMVYSVAEVPTVEYVSDQEKVDVTIVAGQLVAVEFVNSDRGTGDLTVTKEVEHALGTDHVLPAGLRFTLRVELSGVGTADATFTASHSGGTVTAVTTDENGVFYLELEHNEQVTIQGLPAGTTATVTELTPGAGFTPAYWEDDILGDGTVEVPKDDIISVTVANTYVPKAVDSVNIELDGTKILNGTSDWMGKTFQFKLQRWNGTAWVDVATATATEADPTFSFTAALAGETFASVGTYNYQVLEVNGGQTLDGVTYDATLHTFGVIVTDKDMNGHLEIDRVVSYHTGSNFGQNPSGNWDISISYTNAYNATGTSLVLDVKKELVNLPGSPLVSPAGFQFGLYKDDVLAAKSELTDGIGAARFLLHYTLADQGIHEYTLKEIVPAPGINGMTYSEQSYTVRIQVVDNGDGTTSAKILSIDGKEDFVTPIFTNTYAPTKAELPIDFVRKELSGRTQDAGEFTFELREGETVLLTGTNDENGKVTFNGSLSFEKVGTYTYTIVETTADGNGVTVDKTKFVIHVTVTDVGGQLQASYSVLNVVGNAVVFRNTYKAEEVSHSIRGNKVLSGRILLNDEFTFVLAASDEKGNVIAGGTSRQAQNFTDGTFAFDPITYVKAGTYYYVVSEKGSSAASFGITYDVTRYLVTVKVIDNRLGQLEIENVSFQIIGGKSADAITFHNTYKPAPTDAQIPGNKELQGKVLGGGQYSFELYAADSAWAQGKLLETVTNEADGQILFSAIEYDEVGTWYYLVKEVHGGETIDGVTYDDTVYRVMVEITDDLMGQLYSTIHVYDSDDIPQTGVNFVNVYQITGGSDLRLEGTKVLENMTLVDSQFTFELYVTDDTFVISSTPLATATNVGGGFHFDLSYTASMIGKHYYVVVERNAGQTIHGITYSPVHYHVTVTVEDNGTGGTKATAQIFDGEKSVSSLDFVNRYHVTGDADVTISGTKVLENKTLVDGQFTFELYKANASFAPSGNPVATAVNAGGAFGFHMNFTAADIGTHYYVVTEKNAGQLINGITHSADKYLITVVVSDNGVGGVDAVATVSDGSKTVSSMDFVNTYGIAGSASVQLSGTKVVENGTAADGKFTFQLYKTDASFNAVGAPFQTAVNADGKFSFRLNYGVEDLGTHYYVVTERFAGQTIDGITYSTDQYLVTVVVADNGEGGIKATATISNGSKTVSSLDFVNVNLGLGQLTVSKEILHSLGADHVLSTGKHFRIRVQLSGPGTAGVTFQAAHSGGEITSVTTDANGIFYLDLAHNEQVTVKGLPGGTKASVTELNPGTGYTPSYLEDDVIGDGTVTVSAGHVVSVAVENVYEPTAVKPVNVVLQGTKVLTGTDRWDGRTFTFQLQRWDGSKWTTIATADATEASPSFNFNDALAAESFTAAGTYAYQVVEVNGGKVIDGVTYDATLHTFGIIVTDKDMDGKLEIDKVISYHSGKEFTKNSDGNWEINISFTNEYNADGTSLALDVKKALNNESGSPLVDLSGFRFGLYQGTTLVAQSDLSDAAGEARFLLHYGHGEAGIYTYTLKEIVPAAGIEGMTYSTQTYLVKVEVKDNGDGTMSARILSIDGKENFSTPVFTNTYAPNGTSLEIDFVRKELSGRDLKDNEFTFAVRQGSTTLLTGTNDKHGKVTFHGSLSFNKVGTYSYTILETSEDGNGVTVDKAHYVLHVTVTDEGGQLKATASVLNVVGNDVVFHNTYAPEGTISVDLSGTKTLEHMTLVDGQFSFELYNAAGTMIQSATNISGKFGFKLTYSEKDIGTHTYTIVEKNGGKVIDGITYSAAKYLVTVVVADDGKGGVTATATGTKDGKSVTSLDFVNSYNTQGTVSVDLSGTKTLEHMTLVDGQFSFELYNAAGTMIQSATNISGKFGFKLSYSEKDIGTHSYVVTEKNGGKVIDGITYSAAKYLVTVVVADDGKGGITATATISDGSKNVTSLDFVNSYAVSGQTDIQLSGVKTLNGKVLGEGEFTFLLYEADASFGIHTGAAQTVANSADGTIRFAPIAASQPGTYYFVVVEDTSAGAENVTYDASKYHITVVVADNGKGGLEVQSTQILRVTAEGSQQVNEMAFVNVYTPDPDALSLDFAVNKTVTNIGTDVIGPEDFLFQLENMTVGGITTAVSDAGGYAQFTLVYTEADIGKVYTYKLTEVNDGREHVTYSDMAYNITVAITLNESNELVATITNNGAEVEKVVADFENIYDYTSDADPTGDPGLVLWSTMLALSGCGGLVTMKKLGKKKDEE